MCAPCPEPVKEEPTTAPASLDVGRLAIVVHHLGDAANSLVVLGEALLLIYGHRFLPRSVMRGLGLYLDPALSILLSLAIAAAAWPVGKMAAWTLLEGSPVDGLEEELGKVAVVEASALLHLRDDPTERAGLVRLRVRRGDKRRRSDVVAAARRVLHHVECAQSNVAASERVLPLSDTKEGGALMKDCVPGYKASWVAARTALGIEPADPGSGVAGAAEPKKVTFDGCWRSPVDFLPEGTHPQWRQ